jgi:hypothetical protein
MHDVAKWSELEFGHAKLGDVRRTRRLVALGAEVARRPSGRVTKVCATSASREGAFRLLENVDVSAAAIQSAVHEATVRRSAGHGHVVVPLDASSLMITDDGRCKGLGRIGSWSNGAQGIHAMTALAVTGEGMPLGVCGQALWVRSKPSVHGAKGAKGKTSEVIHWCTVLESCHDAFAQHAPDCKPWFQMDRGADCWRVLETVCREKLLATVRSSSNRLIEGEAKKLWSKLEDSPVFARQRLTVPRRACVRRRTRFEGKRAVYNEERPARIASLTVRACRVTLYRAKNVTGAERVSMNAVLVRESGSAEHRIEWLLLTTHSIETREDVLAIVHAYSLRWRIEEFHRAWKDGLCRAEQTQLRSRKAISKWVTILATVATRAMRITYLARTNPDTPALDEFSRTELDALFALRQVRNPPEYASLSLKQVVRWIADHGGYTGAWNGPPGPTVIGRGLHEVLTTARAFEFRDKM